MLEGKQKFLVTVAALTGLTIFCTWGGLPAEQAQSTWTVSFSIAMGVWGAGEAYAKHIKKGTLT